MRIAALVPPILILLGILCHTVLEGLAIGVQVRFFLTASMCSWIKDGPMIHCSKLYNSSVTTETYLHVFCWASCARWCSRGWPSACW